MSPGQWERLLTSIARGEEALGAGDIRALTRMLQPADHWRILGEHAGDATYLDIETTGLGMDGEVTVAACLHRDELLVFVSGEDLDDLLGLLDDVRLLVTFSGASFDVPRIEAAFHIPEIPCAHVDLRWVCYHAELIGGLKAIESQLGIERPDDLKGIDGAAAGALWQRWADRRDVRARKLLERYCAADVVTLPEVSRQVLGRYGHQLPSGEGKAPWHMLPPALPGSEGRPETEPSPGGTSGGNASPAGGVQQPLDQTPRRQDGERAPADAGGHLGPTKLKRVLRERLRQGRR